jgi:hypothetical protein
MSVDPSRRTARSQALAVALGAGAMWWLHRTGHSILAATAIGLVTYAAINLAMLQLGRRLSARRNERQRRNLQEDIDHQRDELYGDGS